ncbi:hypothetical protein DFR59_12422 [Falsibacillus pallidus]|uniref:Membrane protein YufK n=1 Tax=Falsibacillus pallidus TaxID=493781 RepID=A0A370FZN8_9BACI|nr:hypothetical protein DFR59_12422 [Falsibacillus pallidus]
MPKLSFARIEENDTIKRQTDNEGSIKVKNTYLTGYMPLLSILLFSLSFSIYGEGQIISFFKWIGLYKGMREIMSAGEIKVSLLVMIALFMFMLLSALKLIAQTIHELALLFFSKDVEGESLKKVRSGSLIFFTGGTLSIFCAFSVWALVIVFFVTAFGYFVFYLYKVSAGLSVMGLVGIILYEVLSWALFLLVVIYSGFRLYQGLLASLPI